MTSSMRLLVAAVVASVLLVIVYVAAGGRDYRPLATADPCRPRTWPDVQGTTQIAEQVAYSALDGAACELGTSREELTLAFTSRDRLDEFAHSHHLSTEQVTSPPARVCCARSTTASEAAPSTAWRRSCCGSPPARRRSTS